MGTSEKIQTSETKYLVLLENYFNEIFGISYITSHGLDHHRRVWKYAKEILLNLDFYGFETDQSLTDNLIISCYLHDAGMSVDPGFRHGLEGRIICEEFLSLNNLSVFEFSEALLAIENHDNKDYITTNKPENLLTILSVSDDFDAFGFLGIFRYLEIYLIRGKPMRELGYLILNNCENRFNHFMRNYGFIHQLREIHSGRFEIIKSFFLAYNNQTTAYIFDDQNISGYCGLAEIINQCIKENKQIFSSDHFNHPDPVIQWFLAELRNEMAG